MRFTAHMCFGLAVLAFVFAGCAPKAPERPELQGANLGVAGFSQPCHDWEMLAGCLPENLSELEQSTFQELNDILRQELQARGVQAYKGPALVRQCREIVLQEQDNRPFSSLEYWTTVGQCLPVDFLLIPQVFEWREREGGEWGVEDPARVVLDLYLVDVRQPKLVDRFHYEQEQQSLSENILNVKRFFKRQGRWVTAYDLAREGLQQGLIELGL